jgi:hypothetical protein
MSLASIMIGANNPPDCIESGAETSVALSAWLAENPLIYSEEQARDAKLLLDRSKASAGEIEDARVKETKPLNDRLTEINGRYKSMHNTDPKKPGVLDKVMAELKRRLTVYAQVEEDKRLAALEAKRRETEEAERIARNAAAAAQEGIANARAGELGVDVTQLVVAADKAERDFQKADRAEAVAERDANVKIGGGWNRAVGLRTKETLVLESYGRAITAIGPNEKVRDAILSAARDYRKEKGQLPDGVRSETSRAI